MTILQQHCSTSVTDLTNRRNAVIFADAGVSDIRREFVASFDGTRLAVHRLGIGRPVVLLHGLFATAEVNWIQYGHAAQLVEAGFEVIMPDLRGHGHSDAPHDPSAYPPDVLENDVLALVDALGLDEFDLGGFSLGSRVAVRAVLAGLNPRRLVLGGMGLEGIRQWGQRNDFFIDTIDNYDNIERDDPRFQARHLINTMKVDRVAARLLLDADTEMDISAAELQRITMPTLVVCGADDRNNGSGPALAAALRNGSYAEVPDTHIFSVARRELGEAIVRFLSA